MSKSETKMASVLTPRQRKETGSYYTNRQVAQFLVNAVVADGDRVLEPCFGDGVFLDAWQDRTRDHSQRELVGCDVAHEVVVDGRQRYPGLVLHHTDFFDATPGALGQFAAVVGNPPFVRYHRFQGTQRAKALRRAAAAGVQLSALTSAWVPFLIHATQHLGPGGRLGVVAPFELTYARYARPFLAYLGRHFGTVRILSFDEPLFPELNEATVLLLARDWGESAHGIDLIHAKRLSDLAADQIWTHDALAMPLAAWADDSTRAQWVHVPAEVRTLYRALEPVATPLGAVADLTIGYVTGANDWFHLGRAAVRRHGLEDDVQVVVRRHKDLTGRGLELAASDLADLGDTDAHWLFQPRTPLSPASQTYIASGEAAGVPSAYKCRVRSPWWRVPGVRPHDFVLGVLSTEGPRLVTAGVPATNSLLVGDLVDGRDPRMLAAASLTALSALSAELVGHALGGGALKLEPAEARRWLLPLRPNVDGDHIAAIDRSIRQGAWMDAVRQADRVFLEQGLGLHPDDVARLWDATLILRRQRARRA